MWLPMWQMVLTAVAVYVGLGVLFALAFHGAGLHRTDAGVEHAGFVFRLMITPGLVGLWPLMAVKWRTALRGDGPGGADTAGPVETPLSPRGLRSTHRRLALLVLLVVPALAAAALILRPAPAPEQARAVAPDAELPQLVATVEQPFPDLPRADMVRVEVRTDGSAHQLVAEVGTDLEIPDLALYLAPARGYGDTQFLGTLWGPTVHRFALPADFDPDTGWVLKLYSLSHREFVAVHGLSL